MLGKRSAQLGLFGRRVGELSGRHAGVAQPALREGNVDSVPARVVR